MTHIYDSPWTLNRILVFRKRHKLCHIIIIKDEVLSFSWILLFLDVKLSHVNESCMMSHLNLSLADDMLILIDLKFCLFRGSFGSFSPCSASLKVYFFSVGDSDL